MRSGPTYLFRSFLITPFSPDHVLASLHNTKSPTWYSVATLRPLSKRSSASIWSVFQLPFHGELLPPVVCLGRSPPPSTITDSCASPNRSSTTPLPCESAGEYPVRALTQWFIPHTISLSFSSHRDSHSVLAPIALIMVWFCLNLTVRPRCHNCIQDMSYHPPRQKVSKRLAGESQTSVWYESPWVPKLAKHLS